jgi:hypothetical protein
MKIRIGSLGKQKEKRETSDRKSVLAEREERDIESHVFARERRENIGSVVLFFLLSFKQKLIKYTHCTINL